RIRDRGRGLGGRRTRGRGVARRVRRVGSPHRLGRCVACPTWHRVGGSRRRGLPHRRRRVRRRRGMDAHPPLRPRARLRRHRRRRHPRPHTQGRTSSLALASAASHTHGSPRNAGALAHTPTISGDPSTEGKELPMLYGADYNPDQWPEDVWPDDVAHMKAAGVTTVSLGIFAWSRIQPTPDTWDFAWLDRVIELLHEGGIS